MAKVPRATLPEPRSAKPTAPARPSLRVVSAPIGVGVGAPRQLPLPPPQPILDPRLLSPQVASSILPPRPVRSDPVGPRSIARPAVEPKPPEAAAATSATLPDPPATATAAAPAASRLGWAPILGGIGGGIAIIVAINVSAWSASDDRIAARPPVAARPRPEAAPVPALAQTPSPAVEPPVAREAPPRDPSPPSASPSQLDDQRTAARAPDVRLAAKPIQTTAIAKRPSATTKPARRPPPKWDPDALFLTKK